MRLNSRQYELNLQLARPRRPLPAAVQRIAQIGKISAYHSLAYCAANGIGPAGAR